ncbi:MAG: triose-phosphate isomerase [Bacillota bacterium]
MGLRNKLNSPFFYVNSKAYLYGEKLLAFAKKADKLAVKYDIQIIISPQPVDLRLIASNTENLLVFAQNIDPIKEGRGHGLILPAAIKAAGAIGVILNHGEYQLKLSHISKSIEIAKNLNLLTLAAGESLTELAALAKLNPDIILAERSELIGSGKRSSQDYIKNSIEVVKEINPKIMVMQGAGVSTAEDVKSIINTGADAVGAASGIFQSDNPINVLENLISAMK